MGAEAKEPCEPVARDATKELAILHPEYNYTPLSKKAKAEILAQQEATEEETEEYSRTAQGSSEVYP